MSPPEAEAKGVQKKKRPFDMIVRLGEGSSFRWCFLRDGTVDSEARYFTRITTDFWSD
jgi:hypothetical protein